MAEQRRTVWVQLDADVAAKLEEITGQTYDPAGEEVLLTHVEEMLDVLGAPVMVRISALKP